MKDLLFCGYATYESTEVLIKRMEKDLKNSGLKISTKRVHRIESRHHEPPSEKWQIKIELTESDAKLFLKFREFQSDFQVMVESGVFNVRNGVAILNYNAEGHLTQIDFNVIRYKKGMTILAMD